jgi:hypothetical protein
MKELFSAALPPLMRGETRPPPYNRQRTNYYSLLSEKEGSSIVLGLKCSPEPATHWAIAAEHLPIIYQTPLVELKRFSHSLEEIDLHLQNNSISGMKKGLTLLPETIRHRHILKPHSL